ncbi:hypothetical protein M0D21_04300 [Aquimarina sp. D1M17]|uniref:hypothetical protein n=1 Tax=Aquimarina acroporae TaxID=2937283 RepID=UPI0020BE8920|nr:hypothetical protein [Aquimarina acroporae]MCK8520770.1 hypothetical protein [Aquimarina acroporae]
MYFKECIIVLILSTIWISAFGQEELDKKTSNSVIEIFQKEEIHYIENWFNEITNDTVLEQKTVDRFKIITSYYGLKMRQLGENSKLTKIEMIDRFKGLVEKQNEELEQVLPEVLFKKFSQFYDRLYWSISKRLNQL